MTLTIYDIINCYGFARMYSKSCDLISVVKVPQTTWLQLSKMKLLSSFVDDTPDASL